MAPYVRPFLASAQTTLTYTEVGSNGRSIVKRYPFQGLFTTSHISKGGFIGFYNGTIRDLKEGSVYRGKDAYVVSASNVYVKPRRKKGEITFGMAPLALANEPAFGNNTNACFIERSTAKDVVPQLKPSHPITAVVVYACTDIAAGDEIFVHYGENYDRRHYADPRVGKRCYVNLKERESVHSLVAQYGLAYAHVDEECFRDDA